MKRSIFFIILAAAAAFPLFAAADGAAVSEYGRVWSGGPDGRACYFTPRIALSGNFFDWPGDELLVIDYEGVGHSLDWDNSGFKVTWVTDSALVEGNVKTAAAGDIDGDGLDETLLLDGAGEISLVGSGAVGFELLCAGCLPLNIKEAEVKALTAFDFDGDGADEAVAWAVIEGAPYMVFMGWAEGALVVESVKEIFAADDKIEITDMFPSPGGGKSLEYYALMTIGGDPAVSAVRINEEGAELEGATLLPESVYVAAAPGGVGGDTVLMAPATKDDGSSLMLMGPGPDYDIFEYTNFPVKAVFYLAADLNGDGRNELVFLDTGCRFEVHAARTDFRFAMNGKKTGAPKKVRRLSGGRVFVSPDLIPGAQVTEGGGYTMVEKSGVRMVFDDSARTVMISSPDSEESIEADVQYIKEPGVFYIEAESAAKYLGFFCDWDFLSQTLRIKTSG